MKKTIFTFLILILTSCKKEDNENLETNPSKPNFNKPPIELFVYSPTGLNLRENPSTKSKSIVTISYNEKVEFLEELDIEEEINSVKGKWFRVKYKNSNGYIFSSFLSAKSLNRSYNKSRKYYFLSIDMPNCQLDVEEYCTFTVVYDDSNKTINKFENMAKPEWHDELNLAFYTGAGDGGGYYGAKTLINIISRQLTPQYIISGDFDNDQDGFRNQTVEIFDKILIFQLNEKENLLKVIQGEKQENRISLGKILFQKEGSKTNKIKLDNFNEILTFDIEKNLLNKEGFRFQFFKENLEIKY